MSAPRRQPSAALLDDLSLVLPRLEPLASADITCTMAGKSATLDAALGEAARLIRASSAPAITGLEHLSIEACREAVALAEHLRARLLAPHAVLTRAAVTMTATLGHARAAQRVYWVGVTSKQCPPHLVHLLRQAQHETQPSTLEAVQALRRNPSPLQRDRVAAVLLGSDVDARVASQWHGLAAAVQRQVRLAVISVPWPGAPSNARGADEVVTWQTGLSLAAGGVDFSDGGPWPCPALDTLMELHAIDLLITAAPSTFLPRISLGFADPCAAVNFITPGLVPGLAAQVARFDGIVLWLCDDPASAPSDQAVDVLSQLRSRP